MQKKNCLICKKFLAGLFFVLMNVCLYAYGGMMTGEKDIRVTRTEWFDIIYPKRSQATAQILYEKADSVYYEVTAQYNMKPQFRLPVVIVPGVEEFNAFWTSSPYNRIVLYDTGSSGTNELAVFSETFLSVFRHELTHAVTFNMKSKGYFAVDKVLGDYFAPGMFTVTTGMGEGATVTSESAAGEGRLNDEFAKHYVKQAKIEGDFPAYHDVSGSADIQPSGAPYFFNGAFHKWLQDKYGMQKYADFWYNVVNAKKITIKGCFKKAYGINLKNAWNKFVDDYKVPDVEADPVGAGISDFFAGTRNGLSSSLTAGGDKIVWMDRYSKKVSYVYKSEISQLPVKSHKAFELSYMDGARVSSDGRFVAAGRYSINSPFISHRIKIYDFNNHSFYSVKESGLVDAIVLPYDGEYYLVSQKYENQHYYISIKKLIFGDNGKINGEENYLEIKQAREVNPYAFIGLGDGKFAYLEKNRMQYSICTRDLRDNSAVSYHLPQGMAARSLSFDHGTFYFSYAEKDTLPRLGKLDSKTANLIRSDLDVSGGIFEPVSVNDNIIYVGHFYRKNKLLRLNQNDSIFENAENVKLGQPADEASYTLAYEPELASDEKSDSVELPSKSFNVFPYFLRGMLIPLSTYTSDYFGKNAGYTMATNQFPLGITYLTGSPWVNGTSGMIQFSTGWNPYSNSVGASLTYGNGMDNTQIFVYQAEVKSEFDSKGWKQSGGILSLGSRFFLGNVSAMSITNQSAAYIGRQDKQIKVTELSDSFFSDIGIVTPEDDTIYYELIDLINLEFSNIRRTGHGRFENFGMAFGLSFGGRYDASLNQKTNLSFVDIAVLSAHLKFALPKLIPIECEYGFTYNLPLTFETILFPTSSINGYACDDDFTSGNPFIDVKIETTLFGMDVQKAIPGIEAFYLNDFYINAGYAFTGDSWDARKEGFQALNTASYFASLANGKGRIYDSVFLRAGIEFTPNIGRFANSGSKLDLSLALSYFLHSEKTRNAAENFKLILGGRMLF